MITLASGSNSHFLSLWAQTCTDAQHKLDDWISALRESGFKASHPDDGWVDRKRNTVHFAYPQFDDGVEVGDRIALGNPDKYRTVTITGKTDGPFLERWAFRL